MEQDQQPIKAEIVNERELIDNTQQTWDESKTVNFGFQVTELSAVLALCLAISSWIILPIVGAIAALFLAASAKRKIRRSNGQLSGTGIATAAQIIAAANIVAGALIAWLLVSIIRWIF